MPHNGAPIWEVAAFAGMTVKMIEGGSVTPQRVETRGAGKALDRTPQRTAAIV
jgi:hypothetical protein